MTWTRRKAAVTTAAAVVVLAGLVTGALLAFRGGGHARTASVTPSPTAQLRSPFTGEPVSSLNRVLAVKIDNVVLARPSTGLTRADIVYAIPVEGGLSRLLAIFSSHYPPVVGAVRSAREDDLQLLRQFGRPAFALSGATPRLLPHIRRTARIVDLHAGTTRGYYRDLNRVAPYNLYAHTRQLLGQAPAVRGEHRVWQRGRLARWEGLDRALVTANRERWHDVHHRIRPADDLRPGVGLGGAGLPLAGRRAVPQSAMAGISITSGCLRRAGWRHGVDSAEDHPHGRRGHRPDQSGGRCAARAGQRRRGAADGGDACALAPAAVAFHRQAGVLAEPGARSEDRQHRAGAAVDRAGLGGHRVRAAGRGWAEPAAG